MTFPLLNISAFAQSTSNIDYTGIYLEYANDADNNYNNMLNRGISGLILVDLNLDNVPELLTYSSQSAYFDEKGNIVYAGQADVNYDLLEQKVYQYNVERAFSIIDGKVKEDTPWHSDSGTSVLAMNNLPDKFNTDDSEAFSTTVLYPKAREAYFAMNYIPHENNENSRAIFSLIWYDGEQFGYSHEGYDAYFFDTYPEADLPITCVSFYDEENKIKLSKKDAMQQLLDKYEATTKEIENELSEYQPEYDTASRTSNTEENPEYDIDNPFIDDTILNFVGQEYINVRLTYGEPTKILSYNGGNIYYFNDEKYILAFNNVLDAYGEGFIYKDDANFREPYPFSNCTRAYSSISDIIIGLESTRLYSVDEISEYIGIELQSEYSDFDSSYHHTFIYKGMCIDIRNEHSDKINPADSCDIYPGHIGEYKDYSKTIGSSGWQTKLEDIADEPKQGIFTYSSIAGTKDTICKVDANTRGSVIVPNEINGITITDMLPIAFIGCDNVTSVVLPDNMEVIHDNMFKDMTNLESIVLPKNLKFIGRNAFEGCTGLKEITIPYGTVNIGDNAFEGCSNLTTLKIPASVLRVGRQAFKNCISLTNLLFAATLIEGGANVFENCNNLKNVILGDESGSVYSYLSSSGSVLGYKLFSGDSAVENLMILSDVSKMRLKLSDTHLVNAKNIYYVNRDNGYFADCKKATIYDVYNPYDYPALAEFIEYDDFVTIVINDKLVLPLVSPFIENGRTLVPLRDVFENLNMNVYWDESTQTVTAKGDSNIITLQIGNKTAAVNGINKTLDVPAEVINGRTMVPVRFIAESIGADVNWDNERKIVDIKCNLLRNNNIDVKNLMDASYIKLSESGLIKDIQVSETEQSYRVEFDYFNYLHIPMQIMVYSSDDMIVDSFVTGAVWTSDGFVNQIEKTLQTGQYIYDVIVSEKSDNEDYVIPYSDYNLTKFRGDSAIDVPKDGYISVMLPLKGTDAYNAMYIGLVLRTIALAAETIDDYKINDSTAEIESILSNIDWSAFVKSKINTTGIGNVINGVNSSIFDNIVNAANIDEFRESLEAFLNDSNIKIIIEFCHNQIDWSDITAKTVKSVVEDFLTDSANKIIPGVKFAKNIVNTSNGIKQIRLTLNQSDLVQSSYAAEFARAKIIK